ncbi:MULTISPECIES: hypothetical protein [Haloplanus]|jgi:hypothetical protein|nr:MULTISPECIES: hypothetical protein [Haloplanus]
MATATDDADEAAEEPTRPRFRGCVICYSAEWLAYGARTLWR